MEAGVGNGVECKMKHEAARRCISCLQEHRPSEVAPGLQTGLFWERGFALQVPGSLCPFSRKPPRMLWAESTGGAGGAASVRGQFASFVSVQWLLFPSVSQRRIKGPERMKYQTAFYSYLLIAYREFNLDTMSDIVYIL